MKHINTILFFTAGLLVLGVMAFQVKPRAKVPFKTIDQRVDSVLALMTIEEKIGQLTLFTTDWESTGPTIRAGYQEDIRKGRCGALFNSHTAAFTRQLQRIAVEETRLKNPVDFWIRCHSRV